MDGKEDRGPSLRLRAMRLLARREHSRGELERKLAPHAVTEAELRAVLDELERSRRLSDERFAEIRSHALSRKYGPARIGHDLRARGVSESAVARAVSESRAGELERARAIWAKRFGHPPGDALEKARQMRFLQGRGFSIDVIRQVVPRIEEV